MPSFLLNTGPAKNFLKTIYDCSMTILITLIILFAQVNQNVCSAFVILITFVRRYKLCFINFINKNSSLFITDLDGALGFLDFAHKHPPTTTD